VETADQHPSKETNMKVWKGILEDIPDYVIDSGVISKLSSTQLIQLSIAISLKRIADHVSPPTTRVWNVDKGAAE
jgi:hypothetical protein